MTLDQHIDDAAVLAAVLVVLLPLFTSTRAERLDSLRATARSTAADFRREQYLDGALAALTALVFLAGLPLLIDVIACLRPFAAEGTARSLFALAWLMLLGLLAWQASLLRAARVLERGA